MFIRVDGNRSSSRTEQSKHFLEKQEIPTAAGIAAVGDDNDDDIVVLLLFNVEEGFIIILCEISCCSCSSSLGTLYGVLENIRSIHELLSSLPR